MEPQQVSESIGPNRRPHSRLVREIALTLAIKLVLILVIKFVFFSDPVKDSAAERRMAEVFSAEPAAARPLSPHDSQKENK